jgi:hypothetical protein
VSHDDSCSCDLYVAIRELQYVYQKLPAPLPKHYDCVKFKQFGDLVRGLTITPTFYILASVFLLAAVFRLASITNPT